MPGGDGTGPNGAGPLTGRAMGYCVDYNMVGYRSARGGLGPCGRGMAWRRGAGRGFAWRRRAITPKNEKEFLESQLEDIKSQMEGTEKRLKELES